MLLFCLAVRTNIHHQSAKIEKFYNELANSFGLGGFTLLISYLAYRGSSSTKFQVRDDNSLVKMAPKVYFVTVSAFYSKYVSLLADRKLKTF